MARSTSPFDLGCGEPPALLGFSRGIFAQLGRDIVAITSAALARTRYVQRFASFSEEFPGERTRRAAIRWRSPANGVMGQLPLRFIPDFPLHNRLVLAGMTFPLWRIAPR